MRGHRSLRAGAYGAVEAHSVWIWRIGGAPPNFHAPCRKVGCSSAAPVSRDARLQSAHHLEPPDRYRPGAARRTETRRGCERERDVARFAHPRSIESFGRYAHDHDR